MPETLIRPIYSPETEASGETEPRVAGFKTTKGSVYTYDSEGKTTRHKEATGEQMVRQDITVFADLSPEEEQNYLAAMHLHGSKFPPKVYVVERQPDDSSLIVRDVSQVKDPSRLYLIVMKNGQMIRNTPASLVPVVGANAFDSRHYKEGEQWMTERHLGNKVTEIAYEH